MDQPLALVPSAGVAALQSLDGRPASVGGAVVHHSEHAAAGGGVRLGSHDLGRQPIEHHDPGGGLAASEDPGPVAVPGPPGTEAPPRRYSCSTRMTREAPADRLGWQRQRAWMLEVGVLHVRCEPALIVAIAAPTPAST